MKRIRLPRDTFSQFIPLFPEQAVAPWVADRWRSTCTPVIVLLDESLPQAELKGEDLTSIIKALNPSLDIQFYLFGHPPVATNPDAFEKECDRLSLLSNLLAIKECEIAENPNNLLIISTTPDAILAPCPAVEKMHESEVVLSKGQEFHFSSLCETLGNALDYSSEVVCEEPGQFAVRGGIIDVYPVNGNQPVRIDFFGDEIDEIRTFDPTSQRSISVIDEVRISSSGEKISTGKVGEFFHYLPSSVLWAIHEPQNMLSLFPMAFHQAEDEKLSQANFSLSWQRGPQIRDYYWGFSELNVGPGIFDNTSALELCIEPMLEPFTSSGTSSASLPSSRNDGDNRDRVAAKIAKLQKQGYQLCLTIGAESERKRILEILAEEYPKINPLPQIVLAGLRDGFVFHNRKGIDSFQCFGEGSKNGFALLTSREFLGRERSRRPQVSNKARVQRKEVDQSLDFTDLVEGDYLVHHQHGVCRFSTMGKLEKEEQEEEIISVEFADGLLLHVPLQESHLLSRYIGLQKTRPKLAKLGGKSWAKIKQAAEIAALDLAADLLRLQALRDSEVGHAFSPDDQWQKDFENSFPYSETADQLLAIQAVKEDMELEKPMDRLICGDVGFGKTEVAMRAAFKAVMDGKQVALLSPTTILCQQHFNSFSERMLDFPVTIEMLSRFRTPSQQKKIILGIESGGIDILIGTHRMFSDDLKFKDLGLLIIDEEQRFGVQHKEKLKKIRANIDILTLSATPIPRTLYFAMVGARSFSSIETPPVNRRSIRTEVYRKSSDVLQRAIDTEVNRGGQIFYLYNRVKTIHSVAKKISLSYPSLRVAVGHGQMGESELEQVMTEFVAGQYDILVCTTIIESGLDIPNCNTIIIDSADKFGLSQLYQLRGRVGRFTRQAYAYLLINDVQPVTNKAKKRLSALRQSNNLGAGLRIALRDLELRGAGNLLGSEQSGHVAGVGFEMYCRLLKESVSRLKGDEVALRLKAVVRFDFLNSDDSANSRAKESLISSIPANYINEPRLRIEIYRKLARVTEIEEIKELKAELADRFGKFPPETDALFLETEVRCLAEIAGFDVIETKGQSLYCRIPKKPNDLTVHYHRLAGQIPRLSSIKPLLKLKEVIRFLKILNHGKK